jgi:hypothetical protein
MIDYKNKLGKLILFSVSHAIWVICILLFIIGAVFVPGFFKVNNLINVLWGNVSFGFMVLGYFSYSLPEVWISLLNQPSPLRRS